MEKVFKGLSPIDLTEITNARSHNKYVPQYMNSKLYCTTCGNVATQMATFQMEGITRIERFCDSCIHLERHLKPSELMQNFDNLFTRAPPQR